MLLQHGQHNVIYIGYFPHSCLLAVGQHCTGKTLCNIVQEAPDNIAQEKSSFQCCLDTLGKMLHRLNLVQCCPRCSRQQCTGKDTVQCCLNTTLVTTLHK